MENVSNEARRSATFALNKEKLSKAGINVSWREEGHGQPIFFIHGIGTGSGYWEDQFSILSSEYHTVAWDMPGYGASDNISAPPFDVDSYTNVAIELISYLGIWNCHLVGQSLGALIAARLAAQFPRVALSVTLSHPLVGLGRMPKSEREIVAAARIRLFEELGPLRFAHEKGPAILAPNVNHLLRQKVIELMSSVRAPGLRNAVHMMSEADIFDDLSVIKVPTMVICGDCDPVAPLKVCRSISDLSDNIELEVLKDVGHYGAVEKPERYSDLLKYFFDKLSAQFMEI